MNRNIIRFDWAIKRLLRNKANFDILEGLLSELLGEDIKIKSILESEGNKETADNKTNRVDVLTENAKGELIIIEVQCNQEHDYLARMIFGSSKLMVDNMLEGMKFSKIKKIISVNIVFFDLGHGIDYVYYGTSTFTGIHKHDVLELTQREKEVFNCDSVSKLYPQYYIIKVDQFNDVAKDTLDEWINFLNGGDVRKDTQAKGLLAAEKKLNVMLLGAADLKEYEEYIDNTRRTESQISSSKREGIAIGEANKEQYAEEKVQIEVKNKAIAVAKSLMEDGMSIAKIAKYTGLSEDEIRNLILPNNPPLNT